MIYSAISQNGELKMQNEYMRENFKKFLKNHDGARIEFVPVLPESPKQRKFFEGAIVPLITFYQDNMDHRNAEDCYKVREWLKHEFNGEMVVVGGKSKLVAKSTKNVLREGFLERVLDWLIENYNPPHEVLLPEKYKYWRDTVFPFGGPDNYIDYLVSVRLLKQI